jgi:hypothetical protein
VLPAPNQKNNCKLATLSLSKVPVVSPANVIVFFSQVSAISIVYDFDIFLELSWSS